MLYKIASSVAFYCQRCGKIQIFDIPFFSGKTENILRCENCSHKIAYVSVKYKGIEIETHCSVCKNKNSFMYPIKNLKKNSFEKIFCNKDDFELGYIGRRESISEFLDYTQAEYEAVYANDDFLNNQQVLLEAVNRVHDLVKSGSVICPCESHYFSATIEDDAIVLECKNCESFAIIPAKISKDLKQIKKGMNLKFFKSKKSKIHFTPR